MCRRLVGLCRRLVVPSSTTLYRNVQDICGVGGVA